MVGSLPNVFGNFTSLSVLSLINNTLSGQLPINAYFNTTLLDNNVGLSLDLASFCADTTWTQYSAVNIATVLPTCGCANMPACTAMIMPTPTGKPDAANINLALIVGASAGGVVLIIAIATGSLLFKRKRAAKIAELAKRKTVENAQKFTATDYASLFSATMMSKINQETTTAMMGRTFTFADSVHFSGS